MKLCDECQHRETCYKLCPEAELYVNQDNRKKRVNTVVRNLDNLPDREAHGEMMVVGNTVMAMFDKNLSPREKQVAVMLTEGHSIRNIAKALKISRRAVEEFKKRIKRKLI